MPPGLNTLYYGDNLDVLRRYVADESVDLVYLDPPFNSNASYNVLFAEQSGARAAAQIKAFEDTWRWDEGAARAYEEVVERGGRASQALQALRSFLGESDMMAYLAMMAPRLVELRRVLKRTGSIYLHCDPSASHYLKMVLDAIFGPSNFRSEIIWKRSSAHSDSKQGRSIHGHIHDTILFYTKGDKWTWNTVFTPYDREYVESIYRFVEEDTGRRFGSFDITGPGGAAKGNPQYEVLGVTRFWRYSKERMESLVASGRIFQTKAGGVPREKRYLDEMPGVPLQDIWTDIGAIGAQAQERLGYPTQKPVSLLERIITTSSNEGDVILDPFCGCGTAIDAAEKTGRFWVGIDITHLAIGLIKSRLRHTHGEDIEKTYRVIGEPVSLPDAEDLAKSDPWQFQFWALGLVGARPVEEKKGADKGVDGRLFFHEKPGDPTKQIVLSVKAGKLHATYVRDLRGVLDREKAAIGVLISFDRPTKQMVTEAASAGFYTSPWGKHPRLQLLTVEELLAGKRIDYPVPAMSNVTLKKAPKDKGKGAEQTGLFSSN